MDASTALAGRTVVIVEDEFIIGRQLGRALGKLGLQVLGPFAATADARAALRDVVPDLALLDVHLRGETSLELARWLKDRGTRCLFLTGYSDVEEATPRLTKPVRIDAIRDALAALLCEPSD